jgi:hypothetical protein
MKRLGPLLVFFGAGPALASGDNLETPPIVLSAGFEQFIPLESHGSVRAVSVGMGAEILDAGTLSMRLGMGFDPVEAPSGPDAERPWVAMFEYRVHLGIGYSADFVIVGAGGFILGDREEDCSNLVLPYGRIGFGLQMLLANGGEHGDLYLSPHLGVVPGVLYDQGPMSVVAPYAGIDFGYILP